MQAVCTVGIVDVWDRGMCKHPCMPSNEPSSMAVQWLALALGSTPDIGHVSSLHVLPMLEIMIGRSSSQVSL